MRWGGLGPPEGPGVPQRPTAVKRSAGPRRLGELEERRRSPQGEPLSLTPAAPSGMTRSERVDQLRGLAALAIVVCHLGASAYDGAPNLGGEPWPWLGFVMGFGYLGVPLFFVLSGFCIHLPQARREDVEPQWRRFFAGRFWRLYPPYLAAIAIAVVLFAVTQPV